MITYSDTKKYSEKSSGFLNMNISEIYISPHEVAYMFGVDDMLANTLFRMYYNGPKGAPMRIVDFVNFISSNEFLSSKIVSGSLDKASIEQLNSLRVIVNGINSNRVFSLNEIARLMDIDATVIKTIVFITQFKTNDMTIVEFINTIQKFSNKLSFILPQDLIDKINALQLISSSIIQRQLLDSFELFSLLHPIINNEFLSPDTINFLYIVAQSKAEYQPIQLNKFISFSYNDVLSDPLIIKYI